MNIAVIGSGGYVGSALYATLTQSTEHTIVGVTRDTYEETRGETFDIVVNCAMPSGRFWAKNNPEKDFEETVKRTADLVYRWKSKKMIQLSTVSARCQLDTVYGRHKAAAEKLCNFGENLVIRLGALYSEGMQKGVLVDMLEGKTVYVDGKSRYSFISVDFCTHWISSNLHRSGVVELGGKNAIPLQDVARHMGREVVFDGQLNHQDIESAELNLPDAADVLAFLDSR